MIAPYTFRGNRADDLRRLARILYDNGLVRDTEPLLTAAGSCQQEPGPTKWQYEFEGLVFRPIDLKDNQGIRHTHPQSIETIEVELHVCLKGECLQVDNLNDPFTELVVELEIRGYSDDATEYFSAWHLDRQIGAELPNQINHAVHPIYHFQYGGDRVWNKPDKSYGLHLLLETPRFPHPPLDAVLAVDFVLSNYFGDIWNELRQDDAYQELIVSAQSMCWRPYAVAATSQWPQVFGMAAPSNWASQLIWPSLY